MEDNTFELLTEFYSKVKYYLPRKKLHDEIIMQIVCKNVLIEELEKEVVELRNKYENN